ncbi:YaeQ family protein [Sulfurimonas sp. SAG-AH-194-C20]|nr:YaeQ family protein [Sulfurimonas sp. SAG-AH-194-C20]MDF1879361.1 YaeQ family protein [Sulfurimonas sp. SAG-AH-194-C20]
MATKATIYKANINIANMDTHYYAEHPLVLAKHPSENDLRLMVRLTAFILNATETLEFTKGIDQDDEPDLWQKSMSGDIELSIILGQPDEKRIKKASGTSDEVIVYVYQDGMAASWFKQNEKILKRFKNVRVIFLSFSSDIQEICSRSMELQCNTDDRVLTIISGDSSIVVSMDEWR